MPVNAQSVISTALNTFRPDIYNQLTTMENVCYTTPNTSSGILAADAITFFKSQFTSLSNALVSWMQSNRQSALQGFIPAAYGYLTMVSIYGISNSVTASIDSRNIFTCNGYFAHILAQTSSYYNDIVLVQTPSPNTPTSPEFTADLSTISGALALEPTTISSVTSACSSATSSQMMKLLFQDQAPSGTSSKSIMATEFFTTLHYKEVYQGLNVGTLTLPPGV